MIPIHLPEREALMLVTLLLMFAGFPYDCAHADALTLLRLYDSVS